MFYAILFVLAALLTAVYVYIFTVNRSLQVRFWGRFSLAAVLLIVTVFVFNLTFDRLRNLRVDLTSNRVYTISPSTTKILTGLRAPVQITYYVSPRDKMPTMMKQLERDVRDKLEELKIASGGKLQYKVVYADAASALGDKLQRKNIVPKKIQSIDSDEWSLRTAYSSLEISYLQQDPEIVEFIQPENLNNLEYELASRIYKLTFHSDTTDYADDQLFTPAAARESIYPKMTGKVILYYADNIEQNTAKLPENLVGVRESILARLKDLAAGSGGKLEFKEPNPQTTAQLLFELTRRGLFEGVALKADGPAIDLSKDKAAPPAAPDAEKKVYSGVYLNVFGAYDVTVPLVTKDNLARLEIEIHKQIAKKLNRARPKVAIYGPTSALSREQQQMQMMMGQPPSGGEDKYKATQELLRKENYDVVKTEITPASPIPADAQTLVVLAPNALSDRQVYEIEKFVHQGRNLVVAAQRHTYDFQPAPTGGFAVIPAPQENKLDALLKLWGVEVDPAILMDANAEILNLNVSRPVNMGGFRAMAQTTELVKSPIQIRLTDQSFPGNLSLGNRIARLLYFGGSRLKLDEEKLKTSGIDCKIVARASKEAWTSDQSSGMLQADPPTDPAKFLDRPVLSVLLAGKFASTWKDKEPPLYLKEAAEGKPAEPDPASKEANQIVGDPKPSRVLVVGCSEMFKDDFMSEINHQLFFLNAIDALTLGDDLINIRAKLAPESSLKETGEGEKSFWKFFVIGLVPLIVSAAGAVYIAWININAGK